MESLSLADRIHPKLRERCESKAPEITGTSNTGESFKVDMQPADFERLMSAFGTVEPAFAYLMLGNLVYTACNRESPAAEDINSALAAVAGVGARDEIEGMLSAQMVATHVAAMSALYLLSESEGIRQRDSNGNLAVKLLRTYTAQMDALQRYRAKGQQKVTVEHINAHSEGRAVVGALTPKQAGKEKSGEKARAATEITQGSGSPMRSPDPEWEAVPMSGSAREAPV